MDRVIDARVVDRHKQMAVASGNPFDWSDYWQQVGLSDVSGKGRVLKSYKSI